MGESKYDRIERETESGMKLCMEFPKRTEIDGEKIVARGKRYSFRSTERKSEKGQWGRVNCYSRRQTPPQNCFCRQRREK